MSNKYMRHGTHIIDGCHSCDWVLPHIWTGQFTNMNEPLAHSEMNHFTRTSVDNIQQIEQGDKKNEKNMKDMCHVEKRIVLHIPASTTLKSTGIAWIGTPPSCICVRVCIYIYISVCVYAWVCVCVCVCARMRVCVTRIGSFPSCEYMYIYTYIYVYVCIYMNIYMFIFIYIYIYICILSICTYIYKVIEGSYAHIL